MTSIYRTPEQYLLDFLTRLQALRSRITDFNIGSVARTQAEALTLLLSDHSRTADQLRKASFLQTATGSELDTKAGDYVEVRLPAVKASGVIRMTRAAGGVAVTIPAGQTFQTRPAPGFPPVSITTTADGVFATADLTKDVAAAAVTGGVTGNVVDQTVLVPVNPVGGFQSDGGFKAQGAFSNGVDAESDDAFRRRVQTNVKGRTRGKKEAYEAAVLNVPGAVSVAVLEPGDTDPATGNPVAAPTVKIYFEGAASLQFQVDSQVGQARVLCQSPTAVLAAAEPFTVVLTVYVPIGTDAAAITAAVKSVLVAYVEGIGCGQKAYHGQAIRLVDSIDSVIAPAVPFSDFRKTSGAPGTAGDVQLAANKYATLDPANITVTVTPV